MPFCLPRENLSDTNDVSDVYILDILLRKGKIDVKTFIR